MELVGIVLVIVVIFGLLALIDRNRRKRDGTYQMRLLARGEAPPPLPCVILAATGFDLIAGTEATVDVTTDGLLIDDLHGRHLVLLTDGISGLQLRQADRKSGAGVIGGGFGLEGAALGMAAAAVMNSLSAKQERVTVIDVQHASKAVQLGIPDWDARRVRERLGRLFDEHYSRTDTA